jgi:cobyrinic acid a,c-diamide synthase
MVTVPRVVIAAAGSGQGKTSIATGLLGAFRSRGRTVSPHKVGPDYIDPGYHALAAGRPGRNLDPWLVGEELIVPLFVHGATTPALADLAIVEGVMGLFDGRGGLDEAGSTADLARCWDLPIALVVDARGMARSIAPLVRGFASFDPAVRVVAVAANQVGSHRHYAEYLVPALRAAVPSVAPVGYLARQEALAIPSRHLGLVTADEFPPAGAFEDALAAAAEATLDLDRLLSLARPPTLPTVVDESRPAPASVPRRQVRVAVARDPAFCFYYEDNLDLLRAEGADLRSFSPLDDPALPEGVELVYLGGGYPEVFAARLAANAGLRAAIRRFHAEGGAILAECGGLMACAETLRDASGETHPMWALIPARVAMQPRFAALGYVTVAGERVTRLGPEGTLVRGHEFHYSTLEPLAPLRHATRLLRPDRDPKPDGIQIGGLLAGYAHMHFGSNPEVARNLLT